MIGRLHSPTPSRRTLWSLEAPLIRLKSLRACVQMTSLIGVIKRNVKAVNPPVVPKSEGALRCGILGAARIAPAAIIIPAKSHPEVIILAVAARDKKKAETFAKKHGIPKAYSGGSGYQDMLNDPEIDIVYNPLPNGLHYEWTMKALAAGKHVLLEKPTTNTAEDTKKIFEFAQRKGLIVLEAFHSRFHPAINRVKEIIDSGELGKLKSVKSTLCVPWQMHICGDDDIRFKFELGGGILMDMGCYTLAMVRFITSSNPTAVLSAQSEALPNPRNEESKRNIDIGSSAALSFPNDITASIACHTRWHGWGPFGLLPRFPDLIVVGECEGGTVEITNFVLPHSWHTIVVRPKKGEKRIEKAYTFKEGKGEDWWSSYRHQLENFVDRVKGRDPRIWTDGEDSVANMEWIEKIYDKSGYGSRPKSTYVLEDL